MPYKTSVKKIALIINKMKLLIRVLVALLAFCLSTAQKSESYEFTSRLFCTNIDGKRHCVPCSSSNGVITCVPSAISASIQSSGLPSNGNNGIEVGPTTGSAINNIHAPGNRYYTGASAQSNGLQGSGNIRPNYGSNILVGYSPIYDHNINSGGRILSPTLQPTGNNYVLNSSQGRQFQGNANGAYNHRGNIENGGSASPYDSYVDGPDNIPSFD